jgi:hypothetical protein
VESVFINAFACFYYYIVNEDFIFFYTNLVFRNAIIYNFIGYALGVNVDKGILQPIQTCLNIFDSLPTTCVINVFYLPV